MGQLIEIGVQIHINVDIKVTYGIDEKRVVYETT